MNELCFSPYTIFIYVVHASGVDSMCRFMLAQSAEIQHSSFFDWLGAFLSTCLIEAPIYFVAGRALGRSYRTLTVQLFILNLGTHPLVFWGSARLIHQFAGPEWAATLSGEFFAPLMEALLLHFAYRYPVKAAVISAYLANLTSWWLGVYLNAWSL